MSSSLVLWLSLVGFEEQLVLLKKLTLDELGGITRKAFPHVGASTLYFDAPSGPLTTDERLPELENNTKLEVKYNADYLQYEVLSEKPRIFYFPKFLTDEECDAMMAIGKPFIKAAEVGDGSADGRLDRKTRSSQVHFLTHTQEEHWAPKNVKRKVHATTKLPFSYMESLQLQKYSAPRGENFDFYVPHMDSLGGLDRRIATMIFYLDDTEEGGETVFPLVDPSHAGRPGFDLDPNDAMRSAQQQFEDICNNSSDAAPAIKVPTKRGSAVLFYTLKPSKALDPLVTHGSCPVKKGTKWISQQWVRESWQEPLYSHELEAFWGLDMLSSAGGSVGAAEAPLLHHDTKPRPTYKPAFPLSVMGGAGTPLGDANDNAHDHTQVLALSDTVEMCTSQPLYASGHAPSVLSGVRDSHQLTFAFWVKQDGQTADDPAEITLRTAEGADCCEWRLLFENGEEGNGVMVTGPRRDSPIDEGMGLALEYGEWNQIVFSIDNMDPLQNQGKLGKIWKYNSYVGQSAPYGSEHLLQSGDFLREEGEVGVVDVSWDNATLCVSKSRGVTFSDLFLFSKTLSDAHLRHLQNTVVANKRIRDAEFGVEDARA